VVTLGVMKPLAIHFDDITAAAERLRGVAHRTPVLRSATADRRTGAEVFFKAERVAEVPAQD
jgi:threonine dehydratase